MISEALGARAISAILAAFPTSAEHTGNLEVTARALVEAGVDEVVLVEQRAPGSESPVVSELAAALAPRARHLAVTSSRRLVERSRLINQGALIARGERLWVHDPDLVIPFGQALELLRREPALLVKPMSFYARLSPRDRARFLAQRRFDERFFEGRGRQGEAPGKGSYVLDREVFLALGGLQEGFVGEADPGFELVRRLRRLFHDEATFSALRGLSLAGPLGDAERRQREDNRALRERLAARIDDDLEGYLSRHLVSSIPPDWPRLQRLARARQREVALRVTQPRPPPAQPARLTGEIWGVAAYFNPAGYQSKLANYRRFREGLARQRLPLLTVELCSPGRGFELDEGDAERLIQLEEGDALWQKERLLNLGIEALPSGCDKVVWLDADVLFEDPRWVERTAALLSTHVMVQPFSLSVRLRHGETACAVDDLPLGNAEHEVLHSIAYGVSAKGLGCLDSYLVHGHSGYAWAGRREVLARHGLYEANILGNADLNIAHAMFDGPAAIRSTRLSEKARAHLDRWARAFHADVRGSVGHVEGLLFHLWHGDHDDRLYSRRLRVLIDHDFDPEADLSVDPSTGALRWASDKPGLHAWCRRYFRERREDPEGRGR